MSELTEKSPLVEKSEEENVVESAPPRKKKRKRFIPVFALLILIITAAVLVATFWLPVMEIYGTAMAPTLQSGDIVVAVKTENIEPGDIIAFEHNNKILVKRVIAVPNDSVIIDDSGKVFINEWTISEPYLSKKALGQTNIEFPYQVPNNNYFVMGDNRETSVDSRNTSVGCITKDQIVGKLILQVWPLNQLELF
jgi:signal peptidase I